MDLSGLWTGWADRSLAATVAAGALVLATGCGSGGRPVGDDPDAAPPTAPLGAPAADAAERAAKIAARQAAGASDPRYEVLEQPAGGFVASNPEQHFSAELGIEGVRLEGENGADVSFATIGVECNGRLLPTVRVGALRSATRNRVEVTREADGRRVDEWLVNGPLGLEQGFTLPASPCANGADPALVVEVQGAEPVLSGDGRTVYLRTSGGAANARVSDLFALDARGNALPAGFEVAGQRLRLRVSVAGAAWPVVVDPTWVVQTTLTQPDPFAGDVYGYAVSVNGDTAAIGNPNQAYNKPGSVYVWTRSGTNWSLQQKIATGDWLAADYFGNQVALDGSSLLVGAYFQASVKGAAYVFVRSGTTWSQQAKLTASDGVASDYFGTAAALQGDTALVSAPNHTVGGNAKQGIVYVYYRSGTTWTEQTGKLTANDGAANDYFGQSVALDGTTAVVGAYNDDSGKGSAYVFVRSGTTWSQQAKLLASDGAAGYHFGWSSALSGNTVVVGRYNYNGAAYAFVRSGTTWSEQASLANGVIYSGKAVALNGDRALVSVGGGAFLPYFRSGTTWSPDSEKNGNSSDALAMTADTALQSDTVYVLVGQSCNGPSDCKTGFCSDGVCCNSACNGSCDACSVAAGAVVNGLCSILAAGNAGNPACATLACNGASGSCTNCTSDTDCPSGRYCDKNGLCQLQKSQGTACNLQAGQDCKVTDCRACQSGNCVDGYCCDSTCSAACDVCAQALGATTNGTCGTAAQGVNTATCLSPQACNGTAVACPSGCSSDAECATTHYCADNSTCQPRKALGNACDATPGGDCLLGNCRVCSSGNCVDGRCCNTACTEKCAACNLPTKEGTCSPLADGATPDSPGCSGYLCDGASLNCATTCAGNGDCVQPAYYCSGNACQPSGCVSDAGCASDRYCASDGTCKLRKVQASACNTDAGGDCLVAGCRVCDTNNCVDGYCCNTACTDKCGACNLATKGTCSPLADGTAPDAPGCSGYVCDGSITACPSTCANDGDCASTHYCSGNQCLLKACSTDTDCAASYYCASDGNCKPRKGQGLACNASAGGDCNVLGCRVCSSNNCVDGFCCNSACNEPCATCSATGQQGACTAYADGASPDAPGCSGYLCGGATSCPTTCANDGDCDTAHYCSSGQCLAKACTADTDCANTHYCAANGSCTARKGNGNACNVSAGADCQVVGCRVCSSNNCVDGYCCNSACSEQCGTCSGNPPGVCSPMADGAAPDAPGCGGYLCSGSAVSCPSTCVNDGDCASTHFCSAGACVPKKGAGEACTASSQCGDPSFPHCADGVCCNTTCTGKCYACAAANKQSGSAGGTCDAAKQGTNPNNGCIASGSPCGEQATCSGSPGQCAFGAYGTSCGPTSCASSTTVNGKICDGTGACIDQANANCAPYLCKSGACASPCTTGADCTTDYYCSSGTCVAQSNNGQACSSAAQCKSGFCVDGVCCDAPCGGQCEACAESGSVGQCKTVSGAPRGNRTQCTGTGACAGSCNGANPTACTFPSSGTPCAAAQCSGDVSQPAGTCDGAGLCAIPSTKNCAPYACDGGNGTCKASCAGNGDCSQGAVCDTLSGQCSTATATCQDAYTVKLPSGQTQSCAPYKCVAGACQQQCSSAGDCAPGYGCQGSVCVALDGGAAGAGGSAGSGGSSAGTGGSAATGGATGGSGGTSASGGSGASAGAAGAPSTGGKSSSSSEDSGGCGCRTAGRSPSEDERGLAALAVLGLFVARRRRERRERAR